MYCQIVEGHFYILVIEDGKTLFNKSIQDKLVEKKIEWLDLISTIKGEENYCIEYIDPTKQTIVLSLWIIKKIILKKDQSL